MCSSNRPD
uniref:Uncharacterized protein n=1 Tax=Anguilla anguilla TaxID=7936 RepID=A0A0E9U971_ANGAN